MPDPTTIELLISAIDKITAVVVLVVIIYLFVCGKIVAKSTIELTVKKFHDRINGDNDNE